MVRLLEFSVVSAYTTVEALMNTASYSRASCILGGEIQDTIPQAVRLSFCTFSLIYQFLTIY